MVATYEESPQIRTEIDKNKTDVNSIPIQASKSRPDTKICIGGVNPRRCRGFKPVTNEHSPCKGGERCSPSGIRRSPTNLYAMVARGAPTTIGKSLCAQERNLQTACPCNQKQNEVKMERSGGKPKGSQWHLNTSKRITAGSKNMDRSGAKQTIRGLTK